MRFFCFDSAINGAYTLSVLKEKFPAHKCLFDNTPDQRNWDVAPWIFRTDENVHLSVREPFTALKHSIYIESDESLELLAAYLQSLIYVVIDNKPCFFRYWDERVMRKFLNRATVSELSDFFSEYIQAVGFINETEGMVSRNRIGDNRKLVSEEIMMATYFNERNLPADRTLQNN